MDLVNIIYNLIYINLTSFKNDYIQDTGNWVPCGEVGPDNLEFTVKGLTPNKKYKFRVRAVNKEGESDPLETTDAIVAKNPYGK